MALPGIGFPCHPAVDFPKRGIVLAHLAWPWVTRQRVYFLEFDGPLARTVLIQVLGEATSL